ncbi:transmembrane protein [J virus]|uniref:Transmembrane protein n=1 Tax=J virus TaxID=322067 RepID=Q49HN4_9MONO|nr:transmembrane protein [J virus]AAX86033.1 transmembrane protein [J virus]
MTSTVYEDPESALSGYESMRSDGARGLPALPRRCKTANTYRSARRVRVVTRRRVNNSVYFVFIIVCLAILVAMAAYVIIGIEGLKYTRYNSKDVGPDGSKRLEDIDQKLNQISSAVNTIMNALTYSVPSVLSTYRTSLLNRINHLATELKEAARMNNVDLDVKWGSNRTVLLKTGSRFHQLNTRELTTKNTLVTSYPRMPTIIPKVDKKPPSFYPLMKVDSDQDLNEKVKAVTKIFHDMSVTKDSQDEAIWNLNPASK